MWLCVWPCGYVSGPDGLSGLIVMCLVLLLCVWAYGYASVLVGVWLCVRMSGPVVLHLALAVCVGPHGFVPSGGLCAALWVLG